MVVIYIKPSDNTIYNNTVKRAQQRERLINDVIQVTYVTKKCVRNVGLKLYCKSGIDVCVNVFLSRSTIIDYSGNIYLFDLILTSPKSAA